MQTQKSVPNVLSIQDMSSVGRCSLMAAIPILSAMGIHAIPLATAVLSNHLQYANYHIVDLTEHMRPFMDCWEKNGDAFDAVTSGFLASPEQIQLVEHCIDVFAKDHQPVIVDPAMADYGKLYAIYTPTMVEAMRHLVSRAHIIKPNYTEACFLLGSDYDEKAMAEEDVYAMCKQLSAIGPDTVVLSSVPHATKAAVAVYTKSTDTFQLLTGPLVPVHTHGTGDIFTAVLTGAIVQGQSPVAAAQKAMTFTTNCIIKNRENQWDITYDVAFEPFLGELMGK